jgi:hypothetical protein
VDVNFLKSVLITAVANDTARPEGPEDLNVLPHEVASVHSTKSHGLELVIETPEPDACDHPTGAGDMLQRRQQQGRLNGVPMRDERAGSEHDALGRSSDESKRHKGVEVCTVSTLHAVRVVDDMIAHPHCVEPETLGKPAPVEDGVPACEFAEAW